VSRLLRSLATFACLLLVSGLGATSAPASASSSTLCTGYSGCAKAGMGNAGYKAVSGTMWWRMYSGHNCTNYVAYRMVHSGLPNSRPWSGGGNATYWGTANSSVTNAVPAVGAVAWWKANVRPAGSAGHVAYVEQVISADEIIVSQDSWGGDFSWARITRVGGSWPSGFVHFNDVPLTNTAVPTVSGTPKVGAVLSASAGGWTPAGATYAYQWRAGGVPIPAATAAKFTVKLAQQGKRITVRTTATKIGYPTASATSPATPAVLPGQITNSARPIISGDVVVDSTLTASPGSWAPTPSALAYQWSAGGKPIPGATAPTLALGPELVGQALSVTVTASKEGYLAVPVSSALTGPVEKGTLTLTGTPALTGQPRLGQTLGVDLGSVSPAGAESSLSWWRDGVAVDGSTGTTYPLTKSDLGARLRARAVFTKPGYTTLTVRTPTTTLIKTIPTMRVVPSSDRAGRLRAEVTVTAAGVDWVGGTVTVRSRGQVVGQVTLRRVASVLVLTGLPPGRTVFNFRYLGSDTVSGTLWLARAVRIS